MDGERAAAVLRELDGALDRLEQYARDIDFVLFTTQGVHQDGVLRAMTLAGQCAIDLALMIIADRRLGAPPTYRDAFLALARARIIPRESERPLAQWASIRNVIVHLYTKLDLEELHRAYTARTDVLRKFRATAASLLAPSPPPSGAPGKSGPSPAAEAPVPYRRAPSTRPRSPVRTKNR